MCASVLGFECVVLALMSPVLIMVEDVPVGAGLGIGLGLAVASIAIAGLLRHEWAYAAGFAVQVAALAVGLVVPVMIFLGLGFGGLYLAGYLFGRKIEAERPEAG